MIPPRLRQRRPGVDRGAHPRLPLSPPRRGDDLAAGEPETPAAHYAQRMRAMEVTQAVRPGARELLVAAHWQAERNQAQPELDVGRVDTVFKVGDRVRLLRTKELLDAADIAAGGKLRPWWDGPFTVTSPSSSGRGRSRLPGR